ncbi:CAP domain-containing protein [Streptomyces sp. NPDC006552]|uniref:CAP domain-containing protein n=1 Tax=Streptomyces sp. NPDC006552 TaxID=3157179 RepID=UPI0033BBF2E5
MGRHRRSDAGRATDTPESRSPGPYDVPGAYQGTYSAGRADAYPASYLSGDRHQYAAEPADDSARAHSAQRPYDSYDYDPYATSASYDPRASHGPSTPYASSEPYAPYGAHAPGSPGSSEAPDSTPFPDLSAFLDDDATVTAVYGSISSAGGAGQEPHGRSHRRKKRGGVPVRTGLIGVSAAVAMGAVAVASGLIPGADTYKFGGDHDGNTVQAAGSPSVAAQGGTVDERAPSAASRTTERAAPSVSPSKSAAGSPSAAPSKKPAPSTTAAGADASQKKSASPSTAAPQKTRAPRTTAPASSASTTAAQVVNLVNQERAKVGCSPVTADGDLAALATTFSEDMAARGFFDHTDPDGATPWDRAEKAGISNLGGENIARGQATAQSVMEAWMNSPGHKANILNCDYKTLGVGVHFGSGGPWWTQDFGF